MFLVKTKSKEGHLGRLKIIGKKPPDLRLKERNVS